jgi:hypothetical protein
MAEMHTGSSSQKVPDTGQATAWGVGSIVLGLVLPIAVPLGCIAAGTGFTAFATSGGRPSTVDIRGLFTVLLVIWGAIVPVPLAGVWFGIRGLQWAARTGAPQGLPAAGLVICAAALVALGVFLTVVLIIKSNTVG